MSVSASAPGRRRRAQSRPPGSSIMPTARVTGTYFVFGRDKHHVRSGHGRKLRHLRPPINYLVD